MVCWCTARRLEDTLACAAAGGSPPVRVACAHVRSARFAGVGAVGAGSLGSPKIYEPRVTKTRVPQLDLGAPLPGAAVGPWSCGTLYNQCVFGLFVASVDHLGAPTGITAAVFITTRKKFTQILNKYYMAQPMYRCES
eukprot:6183545-Prymnesium_polylepis.1